MAEHTPGPWKVVKPMHGHETEYLCVQVGDDETYSTLELLPADARLMAAAPELLAALDRLLMAVRHDMIDRGLPPEWSPGSPMGRAEAAIARAEGREGQADD